MLTNDEGRTQIPRLTPGVYQLRVSGDGIWTVELDVDVQTGTGLRSIQVRRLGNLKLRALNADGVPVANVELDFVFVETQEDVRSWVEGGRVKSTEGLVTDSHGELLLQHVPHGNYAWQSGASQGVVLVQPKKDSLALIAID